MILAPSVKLSHLGIQPLPQRPNQGKQGLGHERHIPPVTSFNNFRKMDNFHHAICSKRVDVTCRFISAISSSHLGVCNRSLSYISIARPLGNESGHRLSSNSRKQRLLRLLRKVKLYIASLPLQKRHNHEPVGMYRLITTDKGNIRDNFSVAHHESKTSGSQCVQRRRAR